MKFGIVSDIYKDPSFAILNKTADLLKSMQQEVVFPDTRDKHRDHKQANVTGTWEGVDLAISIGGDGTFLYTCHEIYGKGIPLIGVNLGMMGFMTEIESEDLESSLRRLAKGDFTLCKRMMLEVWVLNREGQLLLHAFALNDVVLYRGNISRIIPCTFTLNGNKIETILSDGLIVAGPTGSTGYALACGGPIIHPQLELILFTPISPHSLHNRSYIIEPASVIEIGIEEDYPFRPSLSVDGRSSVNVGPEDRVVIKRAERPMMLASLESYEFFRRLPDKINARGKAR